MVNKEEIEKEIEDIFPWSWNNKFSPRDKEDLVILYKRVFKKGILSQKEKDLKILDESSYDEMMQEDMDNIQEMFYESSMDERDFEAVKRFIKQKIQNGNNR